MAVIPMLGRLRLECPEFQVSLGDIVRIYCRKRLIVVNNLHSQILYRPREASCFDPLFIQHKTLSRVPVSGRTYKHRENARSELDETLETD